MCMCIHQLFVENMPKYTKRTQVLLSEEQYTRLMREAQARGESMGSLIREAVDHAYSSDRERKLEAVKRIAAMELPVADWKSMKEEILTMHDWCPGERDEKS